MHDDLVDRSPSSRSGRVSGGHIKVTALVAVAIDFEKMLGPGAGHCPGRLTCDVLMLGFLNRPEPERTSQSGYVTFFSRTRNPLRTKGETSGNRLNVVSASTDCDFDTIPCRAQVEGEGVVCRTSAPTCFRRVTGQRRCARRKRGPQLRIRFPQQGTATS